MKGPGILLKQTYISNFTCPCCIVFKKYKYCPTIDDGT